uniref:GNAT family N-acetyltransferase n=1 Tax=Altererythrobacter segetis TaxID=1104773 RepID=UPI001408525E|nr:GNAT family N-acetyltransferase [Altererythrobacter segetis]
MAASDGMAGLVVRSARAADCRALERLIGQLGYDAAEADITRRLAEMEQDGRLVLVAELDGEVVGCLSTSMMRVLHRPAPVGRISMMVVDTALRGRGIGAGLVRAAEEALVAAGCQLVEVTSNLARTDAHRFYERLGYERTSVRLAREPAADGR